MAKGNRFVKWMEQKHTRRKKLVALASGAILFLILIPSAFLLVTPFFDRLLIPIIGVWTGALTQLGAPLAMTIGAALMAIGFGYAIWSIVTQYRLGGGTPVPAVPTKKLIVEGPYRNSRNPMYFGTVIMYLGLSVAYQSVSMFIAIFTIFVVPLLLWIKFIEEKELEIRFGDDYREYKRVTAFLIPRPSHRSRSKTLLENGN